MKENKELRALKTLLIERLLNLKPIVTEDHNKGLYNGIREAIYYLDLLMVGVWDADRINERYQQALFNSFSNDLMRDAESEVKRNGNKEK